MSAVRLTPLLLLGLFLSACAPEQLLVMPVTPAMSAEQKATLYGEALDLRWDEVAAQYPSAIRPSVDRVRYVTPGEMPEVMAQCLRAAGFDAEDTSDVEGPSFTAGSAEGQEEGLAIAWYACEAEYPVDPELTQPLSADEIDFMYRYNSDVLLPCLRDLGFEIRDAPSQQTYIDTFGTAEAWYPYLEVYALGQDATELASRECPQNPPGFRE